MDRNRSVTVARLALVAAFVVTQRAGHVRAEHLYVQASGSSAGAIYRYALHNGIPAAKPDFVNSSGLDSPFWVDANGTLYGLAYQAGVPILEVFAPNRMVAERTLMLPAPQFVSVYVGLVAKGGSVLAEFQGLDSLQTPPAAASACGSLGFSSMLVYAPGAKGNDPPLRCFGVPLDPSLGALGLALDSQGSLYIPNFDSVNVYRTPVGNPQFAHSVAGRSFQNVHAVAVDSADVMYALSSNDYSYVAAYAPHASGDVLPIRTFAFPTPMKWDGNIAVEGNFVYVGANDEVLVYDKNAHGRTPPHATLAVAGGSTGAGVYVEVGP